ADPARSHAGRDCGRMTPDPLEIRHLRYFLAVAEAKSFSRAADHLGISQPSVSQQMRDLETSLRVSLFQRRGRRILLTPRGLIFEEHARALLRELDNFLEDLNSEPGQLRGALTLGVIPVLNVPLMPDEICRNHHIRPRSVAEISAIETLLRSLEPLRAAAVMPKITLRGREGLKLKAVPLQGKKLGLDIGLLRLSDSAANSAVAAFT